ncbi:MAG: CDP-alcohol phosphatidyltransferase family protein [Gemmatimonadota bacterium]|nr:CDP-alcohol phosphatidyltransferase family protein [Gemmatimonadota bacterium]
MVRHRSLEAPIPYTRIRELNIFTVPNFLSLSRVLLLPIIYLFLAQETREGSYWALGLMLLAWFTDVADGMLARARNTISSFGKIIDPLADKVCLGAIIIFLIGLRGFPLWLFGLIMARDIVILLTSAVVIRSYKIVFPSNNWGRMYAFSVALLIAVCTLGLGWRIYLELAVFLLLGASSISYALGVSRYITVSARSMEQREEAVGKKRPPARDEPRVGAGVESTGPDTGE